MNKAWLIGILVVALILIVPLVYSHGMGNYGMMGMMGNKGNWQGNHYGYMNMGPMPMGRMMGYPNYGWQYYGWQCPMHNTMNYGNYYNQSKPLNKRDAKKIAEEYLKAWNNPNLKLGRQSENKNEFEIHIINKDNPLVQKLMIDKQYGTIRIEF
jgi:hypothetical protein